VCPRARRRRRRTQVHLWPVATAGDRIRVRRQSRPTHQPAERVRPGRDVATHKIGIVTFNIRRSSDFLSDDSLAEPRRVLLDNSLDGGTQRGRVALLGVIPSVSGRYVRIGVDGVEVSPCFATDRQRTVG